MNNESPAALLPCSCGKQAHVVTRDVEPQNDPWYGKRMETFVICECGVCLFDGGFHDGFSSEVAAVEAWNRRATTAPGASESCVEGIADEWFAAFVRPVAQLLRCLPSYFPAGNEHILRKLRELVGASESRGSVPDGWRTPFRAHRTEIGDHADSIDDADGRVLVHLCPGTVRNESEGGVAALLARLNATPAPPAVSNGEPTAEQWKQAAREIVEFFIGRTLLSAELAKMESRAHELARSAAAKGEG